MRENIAENIEDARREKLAEEIGRIILKQINEKLNSNQQKGA